MNNQYINDKHLRSLMFETRTAVPVIENGEPVIFSSDFDSPKLEEMRLYIRTTETLNGGKLLGITPSVRAVGQATIDEMLSELKESMSNVQLDAGSKSSLANRLRELLQAASDKGVSDIHVEAYTSSTKIYFRVDGRRIVHLEQPDRSYGFDLMSYTFMSKAKNCLQRDFVEQDPNEGRVEEILRVGDLNKATNWRVAYIPTSGGAKLTLRLIAGEATPSLHKIGLTPGMVSLVIKVLNGPSGMILLAGKTGAGKTTTLAAIIARILAERSIHTLEDPPEGNLGIPQTAVTPGRVKLKSDAVQQQQDFAYFSKLLLRHDVDVEMHGEIRDHAGAMAATRKGETGQLVLSTLHCSSAIGIAPTLINQFHVPAAVVASPDLMRLWIYQTLIRTLCPHCKMDAEQARHFYAHRTENVADTSVIEDEDDAVSGQDTTLESLEIILDKLESLIPDTSQVRFKNPDGCSHCVKGEKGRTLVAELLYLDDEDRKYLAAQRYNEWEHALKEKGFKTVRDHALSKIAAGVIDIETAATKISNLLPVAAQDIYASLGLNMTPVVDMAVARKQKVGAI